MAFHGYEEVEHTADIALRVWGEDFQTLLRQAANGMYALMGIVTRQSLSNDQYFTIPNGTPETILVDFLAELLYLVEQKGMRLADFSIQEGQKNISVRATGQKILAQDREIKAITFHNLDVKKNAKGVVTTITFDV